MFLKSVGNNVENNDYRYASDRNIQMKGSLQKMANEGHIQCVSDHYECLSRNVRSLCHQSYAELCSVLFGLFCSVPILSLSVSPYLLL